MKRTAGVDGESCDKESMNLNLKQQGGPRSHYKIYTWSEMGTPISRVFSPQLCIYNKAIYMGYTSIY